MKPLQTLILTLCLFGYGAATAHAADDLAVKRSWQVYYLRSLSPLGPADWPGSGALYEFNNAHTQLAPTGGYYAQGAFAFSGVILGSEYHYVYWNAGSYALPAMGNPAVYFYHYGFHEFALDPYRQYFYFYLDPESYNVAGLRYTGVGVYLSGSGYPYAPGQGYWTPWLYSASPLELAQLVETPSFRVQDYWIGDWGNYPQDAKLPQPQDTVSLSGGALVVRSIHAWGLSMVWVREGVYRPGFTLKPGLSAPALSTYMQQYFHAAYQCDPVTGGVPRTGTPNWNGVGRINTAAAQPTGVLDTNGYYFKPTEFGKAILTTLPQEDGSYGEVPVYTLGMLVDKNRNGTIDTNDVTSAEDPHVFWVNNDSDRSVFETTPDNGFDELDKDPVAEGTDAALAQANRYVPSLRDLEDYDRLHAPGLRELCRDLPPGHTVTLRWLNVVSGSPGVFLFRAAEADGGRNYLTNAVVASNQTFTAEVVVNGVTTIVSPYAVGLVNAANPLVLHDGSTAGTNDFFLYCGTSRGAGELGLEVRKGSQLLGTVSVFLDLRDVKELYERWTVGDDPNTGPTTNAVLFGEGLPPGVQTTAFLGDNPATPQPYILFVHGWNLEPWEKDAFAETAFKRLYWQGYTNRFGAFRWPTDYRFEQDLWRNPGPIFDPSHFDRSEFAAWRSAAGLRQLFVSLNERYPGKVYAFAHSHGNLVVGEALALHAEKYGGGVVINTYVASQAAVSMHCYSGTNSDPVFQLQFEYVHPLLEEVLPPLLIPTHHESGTPNVYRGWLETNRVSSVRRVNFYNLHDNALSMEGWGFDQVMKPNRTGPSTYKYIVRKQGMLLPWLARLGLASPPPAASDFIVPSPARRGGTPPAMRQIPGYFEATDYFGGVTVKRILDWEYKLNDMYETMAFASESRVMPLGIVWQQNVLDDVVDLATIWPADMDPHPRLGTHGRHKWHSAQFRSNNMMQERYWRTILSDRGFNIQ